jgi:hypothetical protein
VVQLSHENSRMIHYQSLTPHLSYYIIFMHVFCCHFIFRTSDVLFQEAPEATKSTGYKRPKGDATVVRKPHCRKLIARS